MYLKAIMNQTPKCKGNVVTATITDPSQASICKREDLIAFIRKELGRTDIIIETELDASAQEGGSTPFTTTEKLHAMVDQNKSLQTLIEKFGLQLD
ncbi:MAG: hypothetical protein PUJ24_01250 [Bacteroidales bacterium]|nr:hypothetical protein [Bacteroidales bacterium]